MQHFSLDALVVSSTESSLIYGAMRINISSLTPKLGGMKLNIGTYFSSQP